jgi:hypothetical protein
MNTTTPTMHQMLVTIEEWKSGRKHNQYEIMFQNKQLLTNIRFNQKSLDNIARNSKGFENLSSTVESPNEVWSELVEGDIVRSYIKIENDNIYVVVTYNGVVENAFISSRNKLNKYRMGVWIV